MAPTRGKLQSGSKGSGGPGGGGGYNFQARATAYVYAHVLAGQQLSFAAQRYPVPLTVWAESGGPGDDLLLIPEPNFLELRIGEVRILGILRSSPPASHAQVTTKIAHLSDTPVPIRKYARHVTDKGAL